MAKNNKNVYKQHIPYVKVIKMVIKGGFNNSLFNSGVSSPQSISLNMSNSYKLNKILTIL